MSLPNGHIGINVSDLAKSKDFYSEVFGLEVLGSQDDGPHRFAFLGKGPNIAVTLWQQSSRKYDAKAAGLHHLSFQADSLDAVRAAETRLKKRGVKFIYDRVVPHLEGAPSGGIFFEDPDGLRLEIFAPTGAEKMPAASGQLPACGFFQ
jgi:lactoylglutathione lyase